MRRPGVRFCRAVFVASLVPFVAGAWLSMLAAGAADYVPLTRRTSLFYGHHDVAVIREDSRHHEHKTAIRRREWLNGRAPLSRLFPRRDPYFELPSWGKGVTSYSIEVPTYCLYVAPAVICVGSFLALSRIKRRARIGECGVCKYSLAGLPVDAAARPECGGKIGKSTA